MAKPPPPSELERLVRYCHPAKILGTTRLPGTLDERALARLYGVTVERYRAVAAAMILEAVEVARDLRRELGPVTPAGPVLTVGDSHTDDLGSWAEIVDAVVDVPVINAGLSGDTTTAARARLHGLPPVAHAFVLLGTNDARRHRDGDMLVSHAETRRNLRAIDNELRRRCAQVTWITPPPVDERRIRAAPALVEAQLSWNLRDVADKAELVREVCADTIDLWPPFKASHLAADGLHPSPAGQRLIATHTLTRLAHADAVSGHLQPGLPSAR
jgi:lysophospholipase L1-like esterase